MRKIVIGLTLMTLIHSAQVIADEEIERENLSLFVKEIDFLISDVDRIRKLSDSNGRLIFDYTSLKEDLRSMRNGIRSYIQKDINDGHSIKPLKGNY